MPGSICQPMLPNAARVSWYRCVFCPWINGARLVIVDSLSGGVPETIVSPSAASPRDLLKEVEEREFGTENKRG